MISSPVIKYSLATDLDVASGDNRGNALRYLAGGLFIVLLLVAGGLGWAAFTNLSGAVIASGTVVVDSSVKKVQHPSGGVVAELRVKDGDMVRAGDLLVRLDETQTRANLQIVTKQLDQLAVREARLEAERDGVRQLALPFALRDRTLDSEMQTTLIAERKLMENRQSSRDGQRAQLEERVAQIRKEIEGLLAQQGAKTKEIDFIAIELDGLENLWRRKLTTLSRITAMRRESTRLDGERGQIIASSAQARGKIAELELQILQVEQDLRTEVTKDLREVQAKVAELSERRVAAEDQAKRIDLLAPQDGIVHELSVHTIGGVIGAGDKIMLIVPVADTLVVDGRVAPQDIDQVHVGAVAYVRFPSLNARTTPEFSGQVSRIAADITQDQANTAPYYLVRIKIDATDVSNLAARSLTLIPGMPAEVHIRTVERTALSYLLKPLMDQISKGFKDR